MDEKVKTQISKEGKLSKIFYSSQVVSLKRKEKEKKKKKESMDREPKESGRAL